MLLRIVVSCQSLFYSMCFHVFSSWFMPITRQSAHAPLGSRFIPVRRSRIDAKPGHPAASTSATMALSPCGEGGCWLTWKMSGHADCSGLVLSVSCARRSWVFLVGSEEAPEQFSVDKYKHELGARIGGVWLGLGNITSAHALWFDMPIRGNFVVLKSKKKEKKSKCILKCVTVSFDSTAGHLPSYEIIPSFHSNPIYKLGWSSKYRRVLGEFSGPVHRAAPIFESPGPGLNESHGRSNLNWRHGQLLLSAIQIWSINNTVISGIDGAVFLRHLGTATPFITPFGKTRMSLARLLCFKKFLPILWSPRRGNPLGLWRCFYYFLGVKGLLNMVSNWYLTNILSLLVQNMDK